MIAIQGHQDWPIVSGMIQTALTEECTAFIRLKRKWKIPYTLDVMNGIKPLRKIGQTASFGEHKKARDITHTKELQVPNSSELLYSSLVVKGEEGDDPRVYWR